jgi:exopolysaccharide production protein ExoZ
MQSNIPFKRVQLNLLQAFRGVAALLVVLFHVDQLSNETMNQPFLFDFFQFGSAGVDYFLVLSGFVAIYANWHELGVRSFAKFKTFLFKRFIRIYPVYWIVSLGVLMFFLVIPGFAKPGDLDPVFLIKSFLLVPQSDSPLLNVGWTLILIVFFYLIFSLIYLMPIRLFLGVAGLFLLGSLTQYIGGLSVTADYPVLRLITNSVNLEFALGCLAAWIVITRNIPQRKTFLYTGAGLLLFFGIIHAYDFILTTPAAVEPVSIFGITVLINRVIFFGIPCFLLVIGAAALDMHKATEIPEWMNYLGNASYSIYLVHSPIVSAMTKISVRLGLNNSVWQAFGVNLMILTVAVGISCLFYSWVEKPVVNFLRQKWVKKRKPT